MTIFPRITRILDVTGFEITVLFDNQVQKTIDFSKYLHDNSDNKFVCDLMNKSYFMNVTIDEIGGVQWPNGFDCSARKIYYWDNIEIPGILTSNH